MASGASLADNDRRPNEGLLQEGQEEHFLQRLEKSEEIESEADEKAPNVPLWLFVGVDNAGELALAAETV
jgi:hypothetical protein